PFEPGRGNAVPVFVNPLYHELRCKNLYDLIKSNKNRYHNMIVFIGFFWAFCRYLPFNGF
ncbi:TPA: hypothetical protein ACFI6S_000277, partial [Neisseria gonorrhoeae]